MVGTAWLYRFAKSLYSLESPKFTECDLVVPLGYGLLDRKHLPDASQKTLREVVQIAYEYRAPIAWASANYFWPGCEAEENQLKVTEANIITWGIKLIVAEGVTNSVTEAQSIKHVLETGVKLPFKTIVVVADWPHARSARKIWMEVFPESAIIVVSIDGRWNESHPGFFQRSELRWLFINIIRHLALIILGAEKVSRFQQPIKKGE